MKRVFALSGKANSGKSTTVRKLFELLRPESSECNILRQTSKEIRAILRIEEVLVGIESKGDVSDHVEASLKDFAQKRCHVIVCACRTKRGNVVTAVECLRPEYDIEWLFKGQVKDPMQQESASIKKAHELAGKVRAAVKAICAIHKSEASPTLIKG